MHGRADVAQLAMLYGRPRPVRDVPAAALLSLRLIDGRVEVEVESPGGRAERFRVERADDPRLAGLRDVDRRRIALALGGAG